MSRTARGTNPNQPKIFGMDNVNYEGPKKASESMDPTVASSAMSDFSPHHKKGKSSRLDALIDTLYDNVTDEYLDTPVVDMNGTVHHTLASIPENDVREISNINYEELSELADDEEIIRDLSEWEITGDISDYPHIVDTLMDYGVNTDGNSVAEDLAMINENYTLKDWDWDQQIEDIRAGGEVSRGEMKLGEYEDPELAEQILDGKEITGTFIEYAERPFDSVRPDDNWAHRPYIVTLECEGRTEEMVMLHGTGLSHDPTVASMVNDYLGITYGESYPDPDITPQDVIYEYGYDIENPTEKREAFMVSEGINRQREQWNRLLGRY